VQALCKSLHQRPRSRLVPLPEFAAEFCTTAPFAQGGLMDALLKAVRERVQVPVVRNDFKAETLSPHLFMNFRVIDEHGRQLGTGRDLPALKAQLGVQARSAFQALATLKVAGPAAGGPNSDGVDTGAAAQRQAPNESRQGQSSAATQQALPSHGAGRGVTATVVAKAQPYSAAAAAQAAEAQQFTAWTFGELPELMEVRRGSQVMVGFPALIDRVSH
jgi:ATP-dependent helicase HrpA